MIKNIDDRATILIVDDINVNLLILSEYLHDYDVMVAKSGVRALEIVAENNIDLILLDIVMPEMDGYEVCKELKESEKTKDIPVIFITSNTDEESIDKAYDVGGIDYITKPFKPKELLARVKTQLNFYFLNSRLEKQVKLIDHYVNFSSTDTNGIITEVSEAFCKMSGYSKDELIGRSHSIMRHSDMPDEIYQNLWETIESGENWVGEIKNRRKNGSYFWTNVIITPRFNKNGKIYGYTAIRNDISTEKEIEKLSITDQLTDLYNRRYFNEVFPKEIKRAIRHKYCLSFIMMDVDFFKQYNDTYGHQAGDIVLSKIGSLLKSSLQRSEDLIFRLGGEEFGLIFTSKDYESARLLAESVRNSIFELQIEHKKSSVAGLLTASLGLVSIDFSKEENVGITTEEFYKLADDELYIAKRDSRNRVSTLEM